MSKKSTGIDMLHGPLLGKILLFALPLALTSILQQLFNSADTAIAGQLVSNDAVAAIGATGPVVNTFINLFVGLSVGANVVAAIHLAWNDTAKTQGAVHTSMLLSLISGSILAIMGLVGARPIMVAIGTPANVLDDAVTYMQIYMAGMPFALIYNFGAALLRAKGDTRRPLYALAASASANLGLDLLFVHLGWGVAGVAWATTVANAANAALVVWWMMREPGELRLDLRKLRITKGPLVHILKIGLPAGIQGAVFSFSNVLIQAAINGFGPEAIAGSAAGVNYEFYSFFFISAFAQTGITFVSQNFARGNFDRCRTIFRTCMLLALGCGAVLGALYWVFAQELVMVFTTNVLAVQYGITRIHIAGWLEILCGTYEVTAGVMRGMGRSTLPAIVTIMGSVVLRIIWLYTVFVACPTFEALIFVYPLSWVLMGIVMNVLYVFVRRRAFRQKAHELGLSQAAA